MIRPYISIIKTKIIELLINCMMNYFHPIDFIYLSIYKYKNRIFLIIHILNSLYFYRIISLIQLIMMIFFMVRLPFFSPESSSITGQVTIFTNYPVTGNQNRNPVHAICICNGTYCFGFIKFSCLLFI